MKLETNRPVIVTGCAGFIGFHVSMRLLAEGHAVAGIDNLNPYYDPRLKKARLSKLMEHDRFHFFRGDIAERETVERVFDVAQPEYVVHLAAQAGVRYSYDNPAAYVTANLNGFFNVMEAARRMRVKHFLFASSSSVYGAITRFPWTESQPADFPVSFYGATKRANEMMAHSYSQLHNMPCTGLRFFTVYGPWGRPDMAIYIFTSSILSGRPIEVAEKGEVERDFTYIDDIVEGVVRATAMIPKPDPNWSGENPNPATSSSPFRVYNIGNSSPVKLNEVIRQIERATNKKAQILERKLPPGDIWRTAANTDDLFEAVGFRPSTPLENGIQNFVSWYREYHKA